MTDVEVFDRERPRLVALAYRMTGTPDDAEDVVQDVWFRWNTAAHESIDNPAAWLTTATTRLAIDRLRSARHQREVYVGPWLPEPVHTGDDDPYQAAIGVESLHLGFMSVLERLQPVERAVFLLHDVFGYPFASVAESVGRSESATRQIASRARTRVQAERPRFDADPDAAIALADAFLAACMLGDVDALRAMLTDDVVHIADGGADHHAARRPVIGPDKVARLLINLAKRMTAGSLLHPVHANGHPAWLIEHEDQPVTLLIPTVVDGRVAAIHAVVNPDKLRRFHREWKAAAQD